MIFHRGYSFFWNWSVDQKYYWICRLFWNRVCVSFTNGEEPIRVKDLWKSGKEGVEMRSR